MRYTDYEKVYELAKDILKDDKKMLLLTKDLEAELKKLKGTFLDDGIDEVSQYVNSLLKMLAGAQDAFMTVANDLIDYARLLQKGKG